MPIGDGSFRSRMRLVLSLLPDIQGCQLRNMGISEVTCLET